jgi:dienelactone hydrolase
LKRLALGGSLRSYETWWARKLRAFPDDRKAMRYDVQALQLGDLTLIALEGEVCADWGPFVRGLAATPHAMVVGYANEVSGYIPTARIVREGGYEGDAAHRVYLLPGPFQPRVEVELTDLVERAIATLSDREPPGTPAPLRRDDLLALPTAEDPSRRIATTEQWEQRRQAIVAAVRQVTGPVPGPAFRVPLDVRVLDEVDCGTYVRKTIAYTVDPDDRVESYLLIPKGINGPVPAVLALHGTNDFGKGSVVGLVEQTPSARRRFYGHELAERGYVVLAPDYWYYGKYRGAAYSPYQSGYVSATMKGVWNHMRAVDVLETVKEVDALRIGSIGHSLGGYNTLFLGLFDPRVKVLVSSAGYNSFVDYAASDYGKGNLANWGIDKHMRRIRTVCGNDPQKVAFDFPELLAALAPRPVFTSAPLRDPYFAHAGVVKCLQAARPVYKLMGCEDHLQAQFPDAEHDFPDESRRAAYEFLDRHLRR